MGEEHNIMQKHRETGENFRETGMNNLGMGDGPSEKLKHWEANENYSETGEHCGEIGNRFNKEFKYREITDNVRRQARAIVRKTITSAKRSGRGR